MSCDEMEERVRSGEDVGEMGHECMPIKSTEKVCTFHPLKMNCYKLWLELHTRLGLIRCKPVYVSPINHGKEEVLKSVFSKGLFSVIVTLRACNNAIFHIITKV